MLHNSSLDPFLFHFVQAFFLLEPLPCLLILLVIFRKKLYRDIPWFTILMSETIISAIAMLLIWQLGTWNQYFIASWMERAVSIVLDFMVILDIIRSLFSEYPSIRRILVSVLVLVGIAVIAVAVIIAPVSIQQFTAKHARAPFILTVDRGLCMIQTGLIMSLFGVCSILGLSWRNYLFGIPFGYGLYATSRVYLVALFMTGNHMLTKVMVATSIAALVMQFVWLFYFLLPDPVSLRKFKPTAAADLDRWNSALSEYLAH